MFRADKGQPTLSVLVNADNLSTRGTFNELILAVAFALVLEHAAFLFQRADLLADVALSPAVVAAHQLSTFGEEGSSRPVNSG
jgi:hypothetical protein